MPTSNSLPQRDLEHILLHTAQLWDELRGARVFLTGGTGFFGRWLLESFVHANRSFNLGAEMVVLSRDPEAFAAKCPATAGDPSLIWHRGDVSHFPFPRGEFSHVIHAASESGPSYASGDGGLRVFETLSQGTRRTLDLAQAAGCRRLLLTSSGAVYGRPAVHQERWSEHDHGSLDPSEARNPYALGKLVSEMFCNNYWRERQLPCVIARCFTFIGPFLDLDAGYAAGNFIRDSLQGGPIKMTGDGTTRRSYMHMVDLTIWLWTLLLRGVPGEAYNVGSEDDISTLELAQLVSQCFDPGVEVKVGPAGDAAKPPDRYVPATAKARSELQLAITIPTGDAVRRTVEYFKEGYEGCQTRP